MTTTAPLRLLMTADAVGGVWQYATTLAARLPAQGIEVLLAVLGPEPSGGQAAAVRALEGVSLLSTGLPLDWMSEPAEATVAAAQIGAIARDEGVDLVHLNSPALAGCARFDVPMVAVAHGCLATWWDAVRNGPLDPSFRWHEEAMARGLRSADLAIAPSAAYAATVRRRYGLSSAPIVVHNGRGSGTPQPTGEPEWAAITVGRLWDDAKNAGVLDRAAALIGAPFFAIGATEGAQGEKVRLEHLQPLGHLAERDLAARLTGRPVFVSAAVFEPFGLAVLEAAQAGCALVLSDIPTFRELWDGAAVFVPAHDPAGFARAIDRVLDDPAERERLGAAARQRAARYGAERMVATMAGHYRTLLARRAAA